MTITHHPTSQGDLPAYVFPADHELALAGEIEVGQIVAFHSRSRLRAAKVVKVTAKRVTAIYTTPGARSEAETIAAIDTVAQAIITRSRDERTAKRYREMAELIEALEIEVTEHKSYDDGKFVPIVSLPQEFQALEAQSSGGNVARSTIVWSPATLREWADGLTSVAAVERYEARLATAREWMAKPLEQRIAESTHVTTKNVRRGEVFEVPEGGEC